MRLQHALLSLVLLGNLASQIPPEAAQPKGPATTASPAETPRFREAGLKLIGDSLEDLRAAHAKDPQAPRVASQKERVEARLLRLQDLLTHLPQKELPLKLLPDGGNDRSAQQVGREILEAIAMENKAWQQDRQSMVMSQPERLFIGASDAIQLLPAESTTIQAILALRPKIYNQITGVQATARLEELEVSIHGLARRWRAFFTNVTLQQYPWESLLNGALDRKHAIQDIPTWELRAFHPVAGLVTYQSRTSSTGPAVAGAELFGIQWFDAAHGYKPTWGLSALWTVRTQEESSHGYGLIGTYREFKLAFKRAKALDGRTHNQALLSINLAKFLNLNGSSSLKADIKRAEDYAKGP